MSSLLNLIKSAKADVFRRVYIKRRLITTGLFETDWVDISRDIKSYGKITSQMDSTRPYKFTFGNVKLVVENDTGLYNPHDSEFSRWYGYLNQQRTLVKIESGFFYTTQRADGVWIRSEFPSQSFWDTAIWDAPSALWDANTPSTIFNGVVSGDIMLSDKNEVALNIKPLISVFQEYPASAVTCWTTTGITASQFLTFVRDHTDGSSNYIFRPFFGDTTTNWDISTTSNVFANFNTAGADEVINKSVWEIIEKMAEAENFVPFVSRTGVFKFVSRDSVTATASFEFHGAGSFNTTYGQTIKEVHSLGKKVSKYYSRVQVRYNKADTSTSYHTVESAFAVSPSNNPWVLGHRTLNLENYFIATSAMASAIATTIHTDLSSLKKEVEFTTSFIPHLDLFDRFAMYYDPSYVSPSSLWDQSNWADDSGENELWLTWDAATGDAVNLQGEEFKFLSFEIDLDNFQNKFLAREL